MEGHEAHKPPRGRMLLAEILVSLLRIRPSSSTLPLLYTPILRCLVLSLPRGRKLFLEQVAFLLLAFEYSRYCRSAVRIQY